VVTCRSSGVDGCGGGTDGVLTQVLLEIAVVRVLNNDPVQLIITLVTADADQTDEMCVLETT